MFQLMKVVKMSYLWICIIALLSSRISLIAAHGKEPIRPNFPPAVMSVLNIPVAPAPPVEKTIQTCLQGYTLLPDGNCVLNLDEPASLACPQNSTVGDHGCKVKVPPLFRCLTGYINIGNNLCSRTVEVPSQFYCPVGYYDDGNACAKNEPPQTITQCDVGEQVGDTCVTVQHAPHDITTNCPEGSEVEDDGNCWKILDTFDCTNQPQPDTRIHVAPKEHVQLGKHVLVTRGKEATFRHLKGTEVNVKTTAVVPAPVIGSVQPMLQPEPCPEEMVAVTAPRPTKVNVVTQVCNKKVQVPALVITSCPSGYSDNGTDCTMQTITPPTTTCLSGPPVNGTCAARVIRTSKYLGCPKDVVSQKGRCYKTEQAPGEYVCPSGFTKEDSECVGVVENPGWECPVGLTLAGNRCRGQKIRPSFALKVSEPCEEPLT